MKILIDMNLSPVWVDYFQEQGIEAAHWIQFENELQNGCMLTLNDAKSKVRLLPFRF